MPIATKITKPLFFMFLFVIMLLLFNGAMTSAATLYIVGELGGSAFWTSSYATTFFSLGNGLTMPLAIAIGPRMGLKRVYIVCLKLFVLSSLFCGLAETYPLFIIGRFLQGIATGPIFVLTTLMLKNIASEEQLKLFISRILLSFIVVPAIGSSVGGTLAYFSHWRLLFYLDALLICVVVGIVYWTWRNFVFERVDMPFDKIGYTTYVIGVTALFCFGIFGQQLDWFSSPLLIWCLILGVFFTLFFVFWSLKQENPILKIELLKDRFFLMILVEVGALFGCYYGMVILLSLWLKLYVNYSVAWINIIIGTMALTAFVVMWTISQVKQQRKMGTLLIAIVLLASSCFYTATFSADVDLFRIGFSRVIAGVGIALFLPPLFYTVISRFEMEDRPYALTWYQVTRTYGAAAGVVGFTTIWQRRDSFFHDRLGSQLTPFSEKVDGFYEKLSPFDLSPMQKVEALGETLGRQAQALALNDSFFLMGWIIIGLGLLCMGRILYIRYRTHKRLLKWEDD